MSFDQVMNELKGKKYRPVYLLMGEEPYFIDTVADYIANNALREDEKAFNQTVMYGKDSTIYQVLDAAKRYPMGAQQQVVIVREAQELTDPDDKRTKGKLDKLQYYVEKPLKSTILVICYKYKTVDKRSKIYKLFDAQDKAKLAAVMPSDKVRDYKLPEWITGYLSGSGFGITPAAGKLLADYLGEDLSKVANELDKLMIVLRSHNETQITPEHIEQNVGISKDYNVFELQKALGARDVLKSNRIVLHFAANPNGNKGANSIQPVISALFGYFVKILTYHYLDNKSQAAQALGVNPYFVKDYEAAARKYPAPQIVRIISVLREYDLKSKGVGSGSTATQGELMREMVFKILH
jgi:DNA polymerase-3 subunit delta